MSTKKTQPGTESDTTLDADVPAGSPGNVIFTVRFPRATRKAMVGLIESAVAEAGACTHDLAIVDTGKEFTTRDITVSVADAKIQLAVHEKLKAIEGVQVLKVSSRVFRAHEGGKIAITPRVPVRNMSDLSKVYTPGVAEVCMAIHRDPALAYNYTIKGTTILIVTDGSRVLALGDIGPKAAMPVMEGKAMLFQKFGGVNAVPICLGTQDTQQIIDTVLNIAPCYGGINLEDIASPRCYEIEKALQAKLDIPVFHDDQHGTAIVVVAAAINAAKLVNKRLSRMKVVCVGTGAAGLASAKLLAAAGVKHIIGFNGKGAVHKDRTDLSEEERWFAETGNPKDFRGSIEQALVGADMVIGLSVAGTIKAEWLKGMKRDGIVFALANPEPEVRPEDADPYVRVIGTGSSKYANQINNALAFPGFFAGLLAGRVTKITEEMKLEAARALAAVVTRDELDDDYVIPSVFKETVAPAVSAAVLRVAAKQGLSGK